MDIGSFIPQMWARVMTFVGVTPTDASDVNAKQVSTAGGGSVDVTQLSFDERVAMMKEKSRPLFEEDDEFGASLMTFPQAQHESNHSAPETNHINDPLNEGAGATVGKTSSGDVTSTPSAKNSQVHSKQDAEQTALVAQVKRWFSQ